jgi:hypothetical protein
MDSRIGVNFVQLSGTAEFSGYIRGEGRDVPGAAVYKIGRSSGYTTGHIAAHYSAYAHESFSVGFLSKTVGSDEAGGCFNVTGDSGALSSTGKGRWLVYSLGLSGLKIRRRKTSFFKRDHLLR